MNSKKIYIFTAIFLSAICSDLAAATQGKKTPTERKKSNKFDRPRRKQEKSEDITAAKKEVVELYRVHTQLSNDLLREVSNLRDKEKLQDVQGFLNGLEVIRETALSYVVNKSAIERLEEEKKVLAKLNEELEGEMNRILELEQTASGRIQEDSNANLPN